MAQESLCTPGADALPRAFGILGSWGASWKVPAGGGLSRAPPHPRSYPIPPKACFKRNQKLE